MCCLKDNVKDVGSRAIVFCLQRIHISLSLSVGGAAYILDMYCGMFKYLFWGTGEVGVHDGVLQHPKVRYGQHEGSIFSVRFAQRH